MLLTQCMLGVHACMLMYMLSAACSHWPDTGCNSHSRHMNETLNIVVTETPCELECMWYLWSCMLSIQHTVLQVIQSEGLIFMVLEYGDIDLARLLAKHEQARREGGGADDLDENFIRLYWQQMLQVHFFSCACCASRISCLLSLFEECLLILHAMQYVYCTPPCSSARCMYTAAYMPLNMKLTSAVRFFCLTHCVGMERHKLLALWVSRRPCQLC